MRRILPTSVSSRCGFMRRLSLLLARAGVADADVHDPPVGIAAPCDRIERHLAQRVDAASGAARAAALAPCPRTSRSSDCGPSTRSARLRDRSVRPRSAPGSPASSCSRTGRGRQPRRRAAPASRGDGRVLHVDRVEDAVARVVGIEQEVGEAGGEVSLEREFREQARPSAGAVEIEVGRERSSSACRGCRAGR